MAECKHPSTNSAMSLACPLCLEVFKDATILLGCGHTFCRNCLKRYDRANRELDHMVCPLCRKITKWEDNRVNDLPSNVAVNDVIAECKSKFGIDRRLKNSKCTACKLEAHASFYCKTCSAFMCDECTKGHKNTSSKFEGHEVTSLQEIINDIKFSSPSEEDIQEDVQVKIDDLLQRCTATIAALKDSEDDVEKIRDQIHAAVDKLQEDIRSAYEAHNKRLEEDHRKLLEEINALQLGFNGDLDVLESQDQAQLQDRNNDVD